jgi:Lrp/AsnC family transcriptional regulator, leucine-responsive regulatory protein
MDHSDLMLLRAVQSDSNRSIQELATSANLSTSACHRRLRALEQAGIVEGYQARLDPKKLGLGVNAFVSIALSSQSQETMARFEEAVARFDEILECHLLSGAADYLLRVVVARLEDYDHVHRTCLAKLPGVSSMQTSFSIRRVKRWSGLPLHQVVLERN